jgi:hypothetical protein
MGFAAVSWTSFRDGHEASSSEICLRRKILYCSVAGLTTSSLMVFYRELWLHGVMAANGLGQVGDSSRSPASSTNHYDVTTVEEDGQGLGEHAGEEDVHI